MALPKARLAWPRLSSRLALLFGLGAVAAVGGRAEATVAADQNGAASDLHVWIQDRQVYVAESTGEYRQLQLGEGERRELIRLIERSQSTDRGAISQPVILAGGGGSGFHWAPAENPRSETPPVPAATGFGPRNSVSPTQNAAPTNSRIPKRTGAPARPEKG